MMVTEGGVVYQEPHQVWAELEACPSLPRTPCAIRRSTHRNPGSGVGQIGPFTGVQSVPESPIRWEVRSPPVHSTLTVLLLVNIPSLGKR